jgi:hypothetical protein
MCLKCNKTVLCPFYKNVDCCSFMAVGRQQWLLNREWQLLAIVNESFRTPCTLTQVTWRLEKNYKNPCYHSCVQFSAFGPQPHLACCLLSAQPVSRGREGFPHGVSTRRPGVDMDTHVSYLASESRYSGAGSLPQSSTSTWYGCMQICSGATPIGQGTFNDYCYSCVYLQFKIEFMLHFIVKLKPHYNHIITTHILPLLLGIYPNTRWLMGLG